MRPRIYSIALVALLAFVAPAQAGKPLPEPKRQVIQDHHLTATQEFQTWTSKTLTAKHTLYVHVYRGGKEVQQRYASGCRASYSGRGLIVRLAVQGCSKPRWAIRLRYVSTARTKQFRVRITTSPCDPVYSTASCY